MTRICVSCYPCYSNFFIRSLINIDGLKLLSHFITITGQSGYLHRLQHFQAAFFEFRPSSCTNCNQIGFFMFSIIYYCPYYEYRANYNNICFNSILLLSASSFILSYQLEILLYLSNDSSIEVGVTKPNGLFQYASSLLL